MQIPLYPDGSDDGWFNATYFTIAKGGLWLDAQFNVPFNRNTDKPVTLDIRKYRFTGSVPANYTSSLYTVLVEGDEISISQSFDNLLNVWLAPELKELTTVEFYYRIYQD